MLHWEFLGLILIVLTTLVFHFIAIGNPATIAWDEIYYVGDARSIISGTGELRPEHPPLAKLFIIAGDYLFNGFKTPEHVTGATNVNNIAGSDKANLISVSDAAQFTAGTTIRIDAEQMDITAVDTANNKISVTRGAGGTVVTAHTAQSKLYVFTDTAFDWRFFSIIFGTLGIIIFYFICRKLKFSVTTATIATFLFALDDMVFIHSGLALLDIYMVTFMLGAVLFYLDERYILSGIFVALAANCKLMGVLIIFAFILHWAIYRKDKWKEFSASLVTAAVSFVFFLEYFDLFIVRGFENPLMRINSLLGGTLGNVFTNPKLSISSRPWTWLYPQWFRAYYMGPNVPVIAYAYNPQYLSFISPTITNPDNPDYRLYDLQSVAQKPDRRFRFALVPGNLCNLDTGGYRNQPDDICFLFSVHHAGHLHRSRDSDCRLAELFEKEAAGTGPDNRRRNRILQRHRVLSVPAPGDFCLL